MEFVSIDEVINEVLAEVPGCPIFTARDRIRWAAIEFCKQTGVSVETTRELDIDADEAVVTLPCPSASVQTWQVLWIKTTRGPVVPLDRRAMSEGRAEWEGLTGDYPKGYVRRGRGLIEFVPVPVATLTEEMSIHCSYIPRRTATRIDRVLVDEYSEALVSGALSRLLKMSKEVWHDKMEARERQEWFSIAMSEARALADKDFQTGPQTVQMRPMA